MLPRHGHGATADCEVQQGAGCMRTWINCTNGINVLSLSRNSFARAAQAQNTMGGMIPATELSLRAGPFLERTPTTCKASSGTTCGWPPGPSLHHNCCCGMNADHIQSCAGSGGQCWNRVRARLCSRAQHDAGRELRILRQARRARLSRRWAWYLRRSHAVRLCRTELLRLGTENCRSFLSGQHRSDMQCQPCLVPWLMLSLVSQCTWLASSLESSGSGGSIPGTASTASGKPSWTPQYQHTYLQQNRARTNTNMSPTMFAATFRLWKFPYHRLRRSVATSL